MSKKLIAIILSPYYEEISKMLVDGAISKINSYKDHEYEIINVPGALEIPAAISIIKDNGKYDGFIALGCVIRGETSHYDYVCKESAKGLNFLAINHKTAIGNGIITVESQEQALARADKNKKDKGGFAAKACIEMIKIKDNFQ